MANQTLLLTAMPCAISVNPDPMPLSVYVSPRLFGDIEQAQLSDFPDWLNWTQLLQTNGMNMTFRCDGVEFTAAVTTTALQPALWNAIFKPDTLVRSHTFDNYAEHKIVSYSNRNALSLIKGLYQQAGIELALPESRDRQQREQPRNYEKLQNLVEGLAVNWDDNLRNFYRDGGRERLRELQAALRQSPLGRDGLYQTAQMDQTQLTNVRRAAAQEFAIYHRMPSGQPIAANPPNFSTLLDFHQVLSSLSSYPELLRALGLILDFELPADAVPITSSGRMSVVATPNWNWEIATQLTALETAYAHVGFGASPRYFLTLPNPNQAEANGLLNLDATRFGLAQVDVDGGMHKTIMLAETVQEQQDDQGMRIAPPDAAHPLVFDPDATLPALRSGGFSLFVDEQGEKMLQSFRESKAFQDATEQQQPQPRPFFAEDLIHAYRLDMWDSHTNQWHSLHRRHALYQIEGQQFSTRDEEGFSELAVAQPAPNPSNPPAPEIYVHEAIARWAGWSLSVPFPGKVLSSDPDPAQVLNQPSTDQNQPVTPFKMTTDFRVVQGSLPSLRFGRRYRLRARVVDVCGNSLPLDHPLLEQLSAQLALPNDPNGVAYLRYEPVISPQIVLRDPKSITDPGSQLDRLVIRTYNDHPSKDGDAADLTASDRHILPPRASVEIAERLGMLDDATGKLSTSPALYTLLAAKDGAELNQTTIRVAGQDQTFPLETGDRIDTLPYIPDILSRGAALRDLPGTPAYTVGTAQPDTAPTAPVPYRVLNDPNPRPGSATLVSFGGSEDWQTTQPFRLALADGTVSPQWDGQNRVLTVALPKGTTAIVPLTSYLHPNDLKLMGIWQWLREYIDDKTAQSPEQTAIAPGQAIDKIAHILQRTVEGGHWMLTPPQLLKLVHAVQQPIGNPTFTALSVQHEPYNELEPGLTILQTAPEIPVRKRDYADQHPVNPLELNSITAWRRLGATDVYLLGGLQIHAASTAKVEILAEWEDPIDDLTQSFAQPVDELGVNELENHYINVTSGERSVGFYEAEHDLICFVKEGDRLGQLGDLLDAKSENYPNLDGTRIWKDAAPRHQINDTKHHRIRYTAVATSRYQDYFPQEQDDPNNPGTLIKRDFTRASLSVMVDVPASARPIAPQIAYVIPTFGWQRQTQTNLKRSVRFGGGLRVYLERPWFSSGEGELLGITLFQYSSNENIEDNRVRDRWKSYITQWGNDPIWQTRGLSEQTPNFYHFPDAIAQEKSLKLEEDSSKRVGVVGYPVAFDPEQQRWYCDLTIDAGATYSPFVRLALVRYQPYALMDAKLSRVVLADFVQLTPERSVMLTADPYQPGQMRIAISGIKPIQPDRANAIMLKLQERDDTLQSDLAWRDAAPDVAEFSPTPNSPNTTFPDSVLYMGTIKLNTALQPDRYRLVISEYESFPADGMAILVPRGSRMIYCETIVLDEALLAAPAIAANRTTF
jgi:hypothetical protein